MGVPEETIRPERRGVRRWRGRSGRSYGLVVQSLDRFALEAGALYLVAKGHLVLWVGSSEDLIADPLSRSRFRLALDCADRAYRVEGIADDMGRMTTIWDMEGAEPEMETAAA